MNAREVFVRECAAAASIWATKAVDLARRARERQYISNKATLIVAPLTMSADERVETERICQRFQDLLFTIPERFFDGDLHQMGQALGYPPEQLRYLLAGWKPFRKDVLARGDLYRTADGSWKMLELNLGSNVGGMVICMTQRLMEEEGLYNRVIDEQRLQSYDIIQGWARAVAGTITRTDRPMTMALVESHQAMSSYSPTLQVMAGEFYAMTGIRAIVCSQRDLVKEADGLYHAGQKIDVLFRLFDLVDLMEAGEEFTPIFEVVEAGLVQMPMGMEYKLLGNKLLFAWLSDPQYQDRFTAEEQAFIDRHVPWTRQLSPELLPELVQNRTRYLVKPADGSGGGGIVCGWETPDSVWQTTLQAMLAAPEPHIVQERVTPQAGQIYSVLPTDEFVPQDVQVLWGVYLFQGRFGGALLRTKTLDGAAVINHNNGAAVGPVFVGTKERAR